MVQIYVQSLLSVFQEITAIEVWVGTQIDSGSEHVSEEAECDVIRSQLESIELHVQEIGMTATLQRIKRFRVELSANSITLPALKSQLQVLREAVIDDTETPLFFCVPSPDAELFNQYDYPFGTEVYFEFPEAEFDISEAGRCISLDRPTAAVFHLMRVMEAGVQRFAKKLGVSLSKMTKAGPTSREKAWNELIRDLRSKINARSEKSARSRAMKEGYSAICNHLDGVRLAWRNPTMHPKASYEPHEAREIYGHVKTFMRSFAEMLWRGVSS